MNSAHDKTFGFRTETEQVRVRVGPEWELSSGDRPHGVPVDLGDRP